MWGKGWEVGRREGDPFLFNDPPSIIIFITWSSSSRDHLHQVVITITWSSSSRDHHNHTSQLLTF
jgi:hypothetical protein